MNSVNLVVWPVDNSLTEIFQTVDIKFAFVNADYEQVHQPCKCRDFLGDLMWSRKYESIAEIYGMEYYYADNPYDTERTRLSLKFPSKDKMNNFIKHFSYLTSREQAHGIPESILLDTDQANTLIIEGVKDWQTSVWKLSLYTFYIKVMAYDDVAKLSTPEIDYKVYLTDEMESKFLSKILSDINPIHEELDYNHNFSGFVSAIKVSHKPQMFTSGAWSVAHEVARRVIGATA